MTPALASIALAGAGLVFGALVFGGGRKRQAGAARLHPSVLSPTTQMPYKPRPLLSAWERRALLSIRAQLPTGFYVCPQARLADMLDTQAGEGRTRAVALNKVTSKSLDFVVIELVTGNVVLAIELDDRSHDRADRRERDAFVDAVLQHCGIPIRRFRPDMPLHVRDFFEARATRAG